MSEEKRTIVRPKFDDLRASEQTYHFNVETPDGQLFQFEFRAPTQSEVWATDLAMRAKPEPPLSGFEGTVAAGDLKPVHNAKDPGYQHALADWVAESMMRKILLCWTEEVPGDTVEEKLAALRDLPNWTISALSRCVTLITMAGQVALADRPFRAELD